MYAIRSYYATPYLGTAQTINAGNITAGAFGSNGSAGDYGFPQRLSLDWGVSTTPITLGQHASTSLAIKNNVGIGTVNANSSLHLYQASGNDAELDLQSVVRITSYNVCYTKLLRALIRLTIKVFTQLS